jgi:hypothetical protein
MSHPSNHVEVKGAPGFTDFSAAIIPGLHGISSAADVEPRTVVVDADGGIFVVPSRCVSFVHKADSPQAAAYRAEWATKADRNPRDVYIPEALR